MMAAYCPGFFLVSVYFFPSGSIAPSRTDTDRQGGALFAQQFCELLQQGVSAQAISNDASIGPQHSPTLSGR